MNADRPGPRMWIDHVILGVHDLDKAAARLAERYGLGSIAGGRHPGWGTANRIVPLGQSYLEILAVVDHPEAQTSPVGRTIRAAIGDREHLIGWCVATDDIDRVAAHLRIPIASGERIRPDGVRLSWRSVGFMSHPDDRSIPFFVQWDVPDDLHPGRATSPHAIEPEGISWVEVAGHPTRLADALMGSDVPLRIVPGPPAVHRVAIQTSTGEIQIG
jgi:hypothetical protein